MNVTPFVRFVVIEPEGELRLSWTSYRAHNGIESPLHEWVYSPFFSCDTRELSSQQLSPGSYIVDAALELEVFAPDSDSYRIVDTVALYTSNKLPAKME